MRLYELNDTVDISVVMEGTRSHRGFEKPLFFARNKERFHTFRQQIVHVVADDTDTNFGKKFSKENMWKIEGQMRSHSLFKFIEAYGGLRESDVLIHGDVDEIPSRELLAYIKKCDVKKYPVAVTSDFFIFSFHWLFQSTTVPFPLIFTSKEISNSGGLLRSKRNSFAPAPLHSGGHLNRFMPGLLHKIYKEAAMGEGGTVDFNLFTQGLVSCAEWLRHGQWGTYKDTRIRANDPKSPYFIPWFAKQNKHRFAWLFIEPETISAMFSGSKNA